VLSVWTAAFLISGGFSLQLHDSASAPQPSQIRDINKDALFVVKYSSNGEQHSFPVYANASAQEQTGKMCFEAKIPDEDCATLMTNVARQLQYELDVHKDSRDSLTVEATPGPHSTWEPRTGGQAHVDAQLSMLQPAFALAFRNYIRMHNHMLDPGTPEGERRFVICQPTSGLGNQLNAIMSCFAYALIAKRAMMLDSEATLRFNMQRSEDEQPHYPIGLSGLFQNAPFDWDVQRILRPRERGGLGLALNSTEAVELYHLSEEHLCQNISALTSEHRFVALTTWAWLPGLVANKDVYPMFQRYFGADRQGVIPLSASLGPLLLRPIRPINAALEALRQLRVSNFSIGIQIRAGGRLRVPSKNDAPMFVMCAYASLPASRRKLPFTMFLVVDTPSLRKVILSQLLRSEGKVAGGHGKIHEFVDREAILWHRFAALVPPVALLPYQVVVVDFESGSRLVFLGRKVDTKTKDGVRMAALEIWTLGALTDLLVVTENSSFADMSHAMYPKPTFTVTSSGRCYPLLSNEPLGAGYQYAAASCYNPRMQQHTWLWQH